MQYEISIALSRTLYIYSSKHLRECFHRVIFTFNDNKFICYYQTITKSNKHYI